MGGEFSIKQVTLMRSQLQKSYSLESSATNKSSEESSATIKASCREFSYTKITLWRIQLQTTLLADNSATTTNHTLERSARNKSHCREFSYISNHPVKSSVESSSLVERDQSHCVEIVHAAISKLQCREIS